MSAPVLRLVLFYLLTCEVLQPSQTQVYFIEAQKQVRNLPDKIEQRKRISPFQDQIVVHAMNGKP
jgi:hypothetical protein